MDEMSEDEDVPGKDEAEETLERLLFGDDEGFHSALKDHRDHALVRATGGSDEEKEAEDEEVEGQDMDGVADADVCFVFGGFSR